VTPLRLAGLALLVLLETGFAAAVTSGGRDPDRLKHFVMDECIPHQVQSDDPSPCALVDLSHGQGAGSVIFYESSHRTQYLVMPTADISGIEDSALLRPGVPNLFAIGWAQRGRVADRLGHALAREDVSLAINSRWARSQNLLHIHLDCLRRDVRDLLAANRSAVGTGWTAFPVPLAGHRYRAQRLSEADLLALDPFRRLAATLKDPASEMGAHTLILVGETFPDGPGFLLLDDHVDLLQHDLAGGESLQDHDCSLGRASAGSAPTDPPGSAIRAPGP
jgi:CDP-diacylglycerol pyrophosphatase